MKKLIVLGVLCIVFCSCKPKQTVTNNKVDNKSQVAIKGNWTLTSVTYPSSDYIKVTSFQIAAFSSSIKWFVNKDGQFILKILDAGEKAKKARDGFILTLAAQTQDSFQLIDKINVGGKITDVVYQFKKIN